MTTLPHITEVKIRKAAYDIGFEAPLKAEEEGWLSWRSSAVPDFIRICPDGEGFRVAVDRGPLAAELARADWPEMQAPPAWRAFAARDVNDLYALLGRIWQLANSLPEAPLAVFQKRMEEETLGATEAQAIVKRRIGQETFRDALMRYWGGRCPLTGVDMADLLRASHIKPWADCESDAERLHVYNGLLLEAGLDAAFDSGLMTFTGAGELLLSDALSPASRTRLTAALATPRLPLTAEHQRFMQWHRERVFHRRPDPAINFPGERR
ncbi:MAG: HNH endonuclease [Alphaproteobacteria bacterium]